MGHYRAYCKRANSFWDLYDDSARKPIRVKSFATVSCVYILYTIKKLILKKNLFLIIEKFWFFLKFELIVIIIINVDTDKSSNIC